MVLDSESPVRALSSENEAFFPICPGFVAEFASPSDTLATSGKKWRDISEIFDEVVDQEWLKTLCSTLHGIFEWLTCVQPQATRVSQDEWLDLLKTSLN